MKFFKTTIQSRLVITAIGILIMLVAIVVITKFFIDGSFKQYKLISNIDKIMNYELQLRRAEKNFLILETINDRFYETGKSIYIEQFQELNKKISSDLDKIAENHVFDDPTLKEKIERTKLLFYEYESDFFTLVNTVRDKGFKDYGIVGEMRTLIHDVETELGNRNDLQANVYMLTLRRNEKDYLLRKDLKYQDKFVKNHLEFVTYLERNTIANENLIAELMLYKDAFERIIEKDKAIGLDADLGLMKELNIDVEKIEMNLGDIQANIERYTRASINKGIITLFIVMAILSSIILAMIFRISKHIVKSLKSLSRYISRLGKGELPEEIEIRNNDEIAEMKKHINVLTANLKNTRDFAISVGNGNFEEDINVFENSGDLGGSLVEMRKKLLQVAEEREKQEREAKIRLWTNEGIGLFSDILRKHDDVKTLSIEIIRNMVKYLEVNQGALFMKNDEENSDFKDEYTGYLELEATYAYERTKFLSKKIPIGDGLVGTCAIEKETIFITDIPSDYINITSGLGDSNPRCILLVPVKIENNVLGVIELASFTEIPQYKVEFAEKVSDSIAATLSSVRVNEVTSKLLERTKFQAEELAAQEEEMRQNMEELTATQEAMSQREKELLEEIGELKEKLNKLEFSNN